MIVMRWPKSNTYADVHALVRGLPAHQIALCQLIESLSSDIHCWMSSKCLSILERLSCSGLALASSSTSLIMQLLQSGFPVSLSRQVIWVSFLTVLFRLLTTSLTFFVLVFFIIYDVFVLSGVLFLSPLSPPWSMPLSAHALIIVIHYLFVYRNRC